MNNREKAIQVIRRQTLVSDLATAKDVTRRLNQAGLITPDLPEPQRRGQQLVWPLQNHGWEVTAADGYVKLTDEYGAILAIDRKTARELGHALLAAANYTEEGNQK